MSREKLTSKQQVIDLLVNKYWWEHKLPIPTPKESPPLYLKEQFVINDLNEPTNQIKPITDSQKQTNVVLNVAPKETPAIGLFDAYKKDLATKSTVKQIELLVKVIKLDANLTVPEKIQLEAYGKELSKEMYTD